MSIKSQISGQSTLMVKSCRPYVHMFDMLDTPFSYGRSANFFMNFPIQKKVVCDLKKCTYPNTAF